MRVQMRWEHAMVPGGPSELEEVIEVEHVSEVVSKLVALARSRASNVKVGMIRASAYTGGGTLLASVSIPVVALRHWEKGVMTTSELLTATADYIEEHGLLYSAWHSVERNDENVPDDMEPCGCLIGTLRLMAGLPPSYGTISNPDDPYTRAMQAIHRATAPERSTGEDGWIPTEEWSDRYADRRLSFDMATHKYHPKLERLPGKEGSPAKVVALLRRVAHEQKEVQA